jgi:hypothetical protein
MTAREVVNELVRRGIVIEIEPPGDRLTLSPARLLDDDLLARVRQHKPEIIAIVSARPATCGPGCYEIEPGRYMHHPERGCRTKVTVAWSAVRPWWTGKCWHCNGTGKCECCVCFQHVPWSNEHEGVCVSCKGTGVLPVSIQ